jgi:hypothetical protein
LPHPFFYVCRKPKIAASGRACQVLASAAEDCDFTESGNPGALTPTWLAAALLVIGANRHRLHWRFDQAERNTQIVQPVLNFLFHRRAPFRVVLSGRNSEALRTDNSPKSYAMLGQIRNDLLLN